MNIPALQPKIDPTNIPLEQLAGNKNVSDREKVAEVSRQFEAVLLRQILQEARQPSAASGAEPSSTSTAVYDDMINNQLADSISRSGSFGLAKSLQVELAHQTLADTPAMMPTPVPGATPSLTQLNLQTHKTSHK